jgi:hypothetical protein
MATATSASDRGAGGDCVPNSTAKRSGKLLKMGDRNGQNNRNCGGNCQGRLRGRLIETAWNAADSNIDPLPPKQKVNAKTGKIEPL